MNNEEGTKYQCQDHTQNEGNKSHLFITKMNRTSCGVHTFIISVVKKFLKFKI